MRYDTRNPAHHAQSYQLCSSWGRHVFGLHEDWIHAPIGGLGLPEERPGAARTALVDHDDNGAGERSPLHDATHYIRKSIVRPLIMRHLFQIVPAPSSPSSSCNFWDLGLWLGWSVHGLALGKKRPWERNGKLGCTNISPRNASPRLLPQPRLSSPCLACFRKLTSAHSPHELIRVSFAHVATVLPTHPAAPLTLPRMHPPYILSDTRRRTRPKECRRRAGP